MEDCHCTAQLGWVDFLDSRLWFMHENWVWGKFGFSFILNMCQDVHILVGLMPDRLDYKWINGHRMIHDNPTNIDFAIRGGWKATFLQAWAILEVYVSWGANDSIWWHWVWLTDRSFTIHFVFTVNYIPLRCLPCLLGLSGDAISCTAIDPIFGIWLKVRFIPTVQWGVEAWPGRPTEPSLWPHIGQQCSGEPHQPQRFAMC